MISRKIWVPSRQVFARFKELSVIQYKNFYKCVDDEEDFILYLNNIINTNSLNHIDLKSLTIIDRFVIFLYLKIYSCGKDLKFSKECEKCSTITTTIFDLNESLDRLASVIDKTFLTDFETDNYTIRCDIPNILYFDSMNFDRESIDEQLQNYLFGYIQSIIIRGNIISFPDISHSQRGDIFKNLNYKDILTVKTEFVDVIYKEFSDLLLMKMECTKCKNPLFTLNFNTGNITDIIKIIYNDDSLENVLAVMSDMSTHGHLDYKFYENLSPLELDMIYSRMKRSQQSSQEVPHNNQQSTDLFDEYRDESKGMVEQPSEFR